MTLHNFSNVEHMLLLDGSHGEGGGQILRSALTLSMLTRTPFRIINIRAKRKKSGLLQQHLTAVQAAARVAQAHVTGAELGAKELTFEPNEVMSGYYEFSIGTAGSTTLVLQTVLLPLVLAAAPSQLVLTGGTHNPFAPPFEFLQKTFLPLLHRMGAPVEAKLLRPGFYPNGGGKLEVFIQPTKQLLPFMLNEAGAVLRQSARVLVSNLPRHIAEREATIIIAEMKLHPNEIGIAELQSGPGNVVMIEIVRETLTEIFTAFGARGLPAEKVARRAVEETKKYLAAQVPVGEHLADQLLLPMALAGEGSFLTLPLTLHTQTNIEVLKQFLEIDIHIEQVSAEQALLRCKRRT